MSDEYSVMVPETSESDISIDPGEEEGAVGGAPLFATPPKKSILRQPGFATPRSEKKRVKFSERRSFSLSVTPACSPAYWGRDYIAREDRANATFFLERSTHSPGSPSSPLPISPVRSSPGSPGIRNRTPERGIRRISTEVSGQLRMHLLRISSPMTITRSSSSERLNGAIATLQSTPIQCGSPGAPVIKFGRREFLGTP